MNALPKKYWRYRRGALSRREFTKGVLAGAISTTAIVLTLTSVTANDVISFGCSISH